MRYTVVVQQVVEFAQTRWKATIPDLPGCVVLADSEKEALSDIQLSAEYHLEGRKRDKEYIPPNTVTTHEIEVN